LLREQDAPSNPQPPPTLKGLGSGCHAYSGHGSPGRPRPPERLPDRRKNLPPENISPAEGPPVGEK